MRQVTEIKKVYSFEDLKTNETLKDKVLQNLYDINVDYEWWECTFDDAENVGIKLTEFDTGRAQMIRGEWIEDACHAARKIEDEHGDECDTCKTTEDFIQERDEILNTAARDENGEFEDERELDNDLDECEKDYLQSILQDYLTILCKEYEYLQSEEAILETIECNEYEFTEDGQIY